jgi:hypothetical protein
MVPFAARVLMSMNSFVDKQAIKRSSIVQGRYPDTVALGCFENQD